ncbi:transposable element Tcb2 transposase [Trichonephila clavipes]|nr:transposable element Tcb2 transposase [Trichonephila clavipes]
MNPIEHVWDALGRRVAGRQSPPQTIQELERALLEEWNRIPQLVINSLIDSMPQRNRRITASNWSRQLCSATGATVSRQNVYRRLGHIGLYARTPVRCVPLTATLFRLRLTWSREHALWTPQQWSCVMFSDKSRFSLQSDSRQTLIWRAPGTSYHQENTIERHRYGGAGWPVWGGIIFGSRTDLHVQSVTMTDHI